MKLHTGIDFAAADGIAYAADDGVVLITEFNVAYGNMTVIDHGTVGGVHMTTLYAHQAAFGVHPGDRVIKGQPIGVIGETGYATGPHLHFEVRIDGDAGRPGAVAEGPRAASALPEVARLAPRTGRAPGAAALMRDLTAGIRSLSAVEADSGRSSSERCVAQRDLGDRLVAPADDSAKECSCAARWCSWGRSQSCRSRGDRGSRRCPAHRRTA